MDRPTEHSSSSSEPLDHLRTNIPSGGLAHDTHDIHESDLHYAGTSEKAPAGDEEDDEDIDALIAELESEDGEVDEEEDAQPGMSARPIPEELLNTDTRKGLTSAEVTERRRRYGLNQMAEEKENLIKKFLMYFVGPIQFVMEVCLTVFIFTDLSRLPPFLQPVFKIG
jgi:H+-transporting ATPase